MKISGLVTCVAAVFLLAACSKQDAAVEPAADEATAEIASQDMGNNDGGIPLSEVDKAAMSQYMIVRKLADSGDFIQANQAARKLTEENPEFVGGWIMLGNTALSGPQFVQATKKATALSSKGTAGEQIWAQINMSAVTNDSEEGLRLGKKLVETYPDAPRAWLVYSGLLIRAPEMKTELSRMPSRRFATILALPTVGMISNSSWISRSLASLFLCRNSAHSPKRKATTSTSFSTRLQRPSEATKLVLDQRP